MLICSSDRLGDRCWLADPCWSTNVVQVIDADRLGDRCWSTWWVIDANRLIELVCADLCVLVFHVMIWVSISHYNSVHILMLYDLNKYCIHARLSRLNDRTQSSSSSSSSYSSYASSSPSSTTSSISFPLVCSMIDADCSKVQVYARWSMRMCLHGCLYAALTDFACSTIGDRCRQTWLVHAQCR